MNIGMLPIMGIPLPFLSYGGTNTIISIVFLGISLNKKS
jgi:rod shape determining protein RodA